MGKTKKDEEKTAIKKDKTIKKNKPKPDKVVKDGSSIVKGKTKKPKKKSEKAKGIAIEGAAVEQREVYKSQKAVLNRKQAKADDKEGSLKLKIRALKDPKDPAEYLETWKSNKKEWKFNKNLQNWLLTNVYDESKVDKGTFKLMLKYCADMKGAAREWAMADARLVVERADSVAKQAEDQTEEKRREAAERESDRMKARKKKAVKMLDALSVDEEDEDSE
mmetsp:Transcript_20850/g.34889  ORF Transcript_20850/g.34889 Transcript_20850/m.34889 type:complete len:220 (-) Transcript_20850:215-874(-)|eukprot:CAMPEP_0198213848 /NCGR_PEP_ID=MMETSP1445-20131203/34493_1 /TAXON_ID=36898 /ORGANISM="Pyramimonas sp., Strain CCMP2087" /LENGTH=219 /DNA_ID=CAMNT_0043888689 /DNA_START=120 /DNA_END=779 /DNA_ORIENTATION=+